MITKWDKRYLRLAYFVSGWSKDPSTKVGTVIARPNKSVCSVGFNGLPMGVKDTEERLTNRELKYPMIVHGELNAISFAQDPTMEGYTLYNMPFQPCSKCAGPIIQKGIKRVVAPWSDNPRWVEDFNLAAQMFSEKGVILELFAGDINDDQDERKEKEEPNTETSKDKARDPIVHKGLTKF